MLKKRRIMNRDHAVQAVMEEQKADKLKEWEEQYPKLGLMPSDIRQQYLRMKANKPTKMIKGRVGKSRPKERTHGKR